MTLALTLRLISAACLILVRTGCRPAGSDDIQEESTIRSVIAAFDSAWYRKDTSTTGAMMAPSYVYFSSRGRVIPRAELLTMFGAEHYQLEYADRSELEVHVAGATAVVGSRWRGRGTYEGTEFVDDQRCSLVLGRESDGWRMLSEHCTQIVP